MICVICGKKFEACRSTQKYCSAACRRYANRHGGNDHAEFPVPVEKPVIREFRCLKCGKIVYVTEPEDCRLKFCSQRCEKAYWKHSKRVRPLTVYREFCCRKCGKPVVVTDPKDRRTVFCSQYCRTHCFDPQKKYSRKKV